MGEQIKRKLSKVKDTSLLCRRENRGLREEIIKEKVNGQDSVEADEWRGRGRDEHIKRKSRK